MSEGDSRRIACDLMSEPHVRGRRITEDLLLISIDREGGRQGITPDGNTEILPGDAVTLFSRTGIADKTLRAFSD